MNWGFRMMRCCLMLVAAGQGQTNGITGSPQQNQEVLIDHSPFAIVGGTPEQEALLRNAIPAMHPVVMPSRIVFVPHWKYLYTAKVFQLHVPAGMSSRMFTHLPSRTTFIDVDHCWSNECLQYWMAHELGHLAKNSADESDAEKAATGYRKQLAVALSQKTH